MNAGHYGHRPPPPAARKLRPFDWPHEHLPTVVPEETGPGAIHGKLTDQDIADRMGCGRRYVQRMKSRGLTYWQAEQIAIVVLGDHPARVFPDWWAVTDIYIVTCNHTDAEEAA